MRILTLKKDPEGEISNWARKELDEARNEPVENYFSLEELKKDILNN